MTERSVKEDENIVALEFKSPAPIGDYKFIQDRINKEKSVIEEELEVETEFQKLTALKFIKKKGIRDYIVRVNANGQYIDVWLKGSDCYGCKEVENADSEMEFFN